METKIVCKDHYYLCNFSFVNFASFKLLIFLIQILNVFNPKIF